MLETINDQDRELLEGLLHPNQLVVSRWYAEYFPGIRRYVTNHGGNKQDAEDVFQDALLIIFQKLKQDQLQLTASLRTYLLAVCRNVWRSRRRSRKELALAEGEGGQIEDMSADIELRLHRLHRERIYGRYFKQLGGGCQRILRLFFAKVKLSEIAERLDLSPNYVKKKKFECKEKLIRMIKADPSYTELQDE